MWKPRDSTLLPSREEISSQRAIVSKLSDSLSTLSSERHRLQSRLTSLRAELGELEREESELSERINGISQEKEEREAWIAPQRKLPKEMLAEIFVWHVHYEWNAPLTDGAVCRRWRSTALSTPRLWSYIRFPYPVSAQLVQLWLQRSGGAIPLHIHLNDEDIHPLLEPCLPSALCLKFSPWPALLVGHSFTRLEKLILDHEDATLENLARDCFRAMPRLRYLHLHWYRPSRRPLLKWDWDLPPLTEFHFAGQTWAWIDAVSQLTSSLECLALDIGDVSTPPPPSLASLPGTAGFTFPKLRYFAFGALSRTLLTNDAARIPIIAKMIKAPNLETFEDHSVSPIGLSPPPSDNWDFPNLSNYIGQTSRELGQVKALYPHIRTISFVVDSETGVLDVATLIDDAKDGVLDNLQEMVMWLGSRLEHHPMIEQSLRQFEQRKNRKLQLSFLSVKDDTLYQKCFFGFSCCRLLQENPLETSKASSDLVDGIDGMDGIDGVDGINGKH